MATSMEPMDSTLATRMFLAPGSITTSLHQLWTLETLVQGAPSSPESLTGILRLERE